MPDNDDDDVVPIGGGGPPSVEIQLRGDQVMEILRSLRDHLSVEKTDKDVVLRALGVLYQAIGKRVLLIDAGGKTTELYGLWK